MAFVSGAALNLQVLNRSLRADAPRCRRRGAHWRAAAAGDAVREAIAEKAGAERGILGLDRELRGVIHAAVERAEASPVVAAPAKDDAAAVHGAWRLLYTTLTILGRRRVRLAIAAKGRPGFVSLGDFYQIIDSGRRESRNVVVFDMALGGSGTFTINAGYETESDSRVRVEMVDSVLQPQKLEELLGDNISLLTDIFDPSGHLDITYLDENLRIGRDDKGNLFVLERCEDPVLE